MGKMKLKLIPSCTQQPRTVSFRSTTTITTAKKVDNDVYKTINSVYNNYFDPEPDSVETPQSWFTHSSESSTSTITSTGTAAEYDDSSSSSHLEAVIRGAQRSTTDQRLFFTPGGETSSIMSDPESSPRLKSIICSDTRSLTSFISKRKEVEIAPTFLSPSSKRESPSPKLKTVFDSSDVRSRTSNSRERQKVERAPTFLSSPSKDASSMMMAMESEDPYNDFKTSMEEMVESLGVRDDDWEELEELLGWYLKVNGKSTHGYIVQAFVDLIVPGFGDVVIGAKKDNTTNNHDQDYDENSKSATSFSSAASSLSSSSPVSTSAQLLEEDSDHFMC